MSGNESTKKKFKRPKQLTTSTTNPSASAGTSHQNEQSSPKPVCVLAAKDSEWVDIIQTSLPETRTSLQSEEEEVLQLVDCEEGLQSEPLAVMFPGLQENPGTLRQILNRDLSTTEVTKRLVDLGKKADFSFMKKSSRLIPPDKKWLEGVTENCDDTILSIGSSTLLGSFSSNYEAESDAVEENDERKVLKFKKKPKAVAPINLHIDSNSDTSNRIALGEPADTSNPIQESRSSCHDATKRKY